MDLTFILSAACGSQRGSNRIGIVVVVVVAVVVFLCMEKVLLHIGQL